MSKLRLVSYLSPGYVLSLLRQLGVPESCIGETHVQSQYWLSDPVMLGGDQLDIVVYLWSAPSVMRHQSHLQITEGNGPEVPRCNSSRYQDLPGLSDIIVNAESGLKTFDELQNTVLQTDPGSTVLTQLANNGSPAWASPVAFFGKVIQSGLHQSSIRLSCCKDWLTVRRLVARVSALSVTLMRV